MAKKKNWFTLVKRFFSSDSQSKQEKKEKMRRRWVFAKLRMKRIPSLTAPPQTQPKPEIVGEEEEEEEASKPSNYALSVALASAAVAEAAVAAAHAAVEVVRLTSTAPATLSGETDTIGSAESPSRCRRDAGESSAVKIQAAFRGYLARKALRALKGIVTLQAIIRGRAVRRQAVTTLMRLQSIVNIQSQVCANRLQSTESAYDCDDSDPLNDFRDKMLRMDSLNERRWDDSLLSKEEAEAMFMSKKEAAIRRERIREYWHSHRKSAESERKQVSGRWRYWLEQWVDTQLTKSKELEDLHTNPKDDFGVKKLNLRKLQTHYPNEAFMESPSTKASHRRQCSLGDETSFASSPIVPAYMAATESARAKSRSLSSPKLRTESLDGFSPSKNKLSLMSSIASEIPISSSPMMGGFHQRSPSLKGVRGPVKSNRKMMKDLSFDSECSLSHWNQQNSIR